MQIEFEMPRFWVDTIGRQIETGVDTVCVEFEPDFSMGSYDYEFTAVYVHGAPPGERDKWHEIPLTSYHAKAACKYAKEQCSEIIDEKLSEYRADAKASAGGRRYEETF